MLEFFMVIDQNWPLALLITFAFWPGLMFLVGWIGESRLIPMGENQSKAFFPGDFAFGVMFVVLAMFYVRAEEIDPGIIGILEDSSWIRLCIILSLICFIFLRRRDRFKYPKRAFRSPTKICHDIVGFMVIPFMLIWMEYPALSLWVRSMWFGRQPNLSKIAFPIEVIVLMWMIYIFCWWNDYNNVKMVDNVKYMHIVRWRPLWKRRPPQ